MDPRKLEIIIKKFELAVLEAEEGLQNALNDNDINFLIIESRINDLRQAKGNLSEWNEILRPSPYQENINENKNEENGIIE